MKKLITIGIIVLTLITGLCSYSQFSLNALQLGAFNTLILRMWPLTQSVATRTDINGSGLTAGCSFIPVTNITVYALGVTNCSAANSQTHIIGLYNVSGGVTNIVASTLVSFSGVGLAVVWGNITPVTLPAFSTNFLGVSSSYGDKWIDIGTPTTNNIIRINNACFGNQTANTTLAPQMNTLGPTPQFRSYGGVFLKYH